MAGYKPSKQRGKATNKQKNARRDHSKKTSKYKSDATNTICCVFHEPSATYAETVNGTQIAHGALTNIGAIAINDPILLSASVPLDARSALFNSIRHNSMIKMFNEWNTTAVYIDLLFSPDLRVNCDQVFLLVERGVPGQITTVNQMVTDINCRMYQLGNNTQKLTFKHIFNTAQDKINKKSTDTVNSIDIGNAYFLKVLCTGKNCNGSQLQVGDLQIKMRAKFYNQYRDMKALSAALN
jgi:hypothetical protein